MLEPSLTHIGGAKLLGTTLMPASLLVLMGVLAWQLWQSKQALNQLEQQVKGQQQQLSQQLNELKQQIQTSAPSAAATPKYSTAATANPSKLAMLKRLVEDNLSLRKQF